MFVEVAAPPRPMDMAIKAARPSLPRAIRRAAPPYLYLAPALILLGIWVYRPLAQTAQLSFYSWNLLPTTPMEPVGLDNYRRMMDSPELGDALWRTLEVILGLLPFSIVVPVVVGLLTRRLGGRSRAV